jgi:23S rRNA (cytosine1962-C5)-methyltransferase
LCGIPAPDDRNIALRVTPEAEQAVRGGHPWVFEGAITHQSHDGRPGDLAVVFDSKRRFLAVGLYDPGAKIRVRVLQHREPAPIDQDWFAARLASAARLRAPLLGRPAGQATTGYRLVHGENDGLPGLVVDCYEGTLVLKLYSAAWIPHLSDVLPALSSVRPYERVVLRLGRAAMARPADLHGLADGETLAGRDFDGPMLFQENGLWFEADLVRGHKTGFYFDQRDNRARVEALAGGKSVLDVFTYTGAFSVYAARGEARHIVSVDRSAPALEVVGRNLARNWRSPTVGAAMHEVVEGDAFDALDRMARSGRRFDLVIVDPPAFARTKSQVAHALAAYERLTRLSLNVLRPGGTLVQASCSRQVQAEAFVLAVCGAAARAGRPLLEIERTGHALDHPVTFREGAYLKCVFATAP